MAMELLESLKMWYEEEKGLSLNAVQVPRTEVNQEEDIL